MMSKIDCPSAIEDLVAERKGGGVTNDVESRGRVEVGADAVGNTPAAGAEFRPKL